jgi:hypothetical protein
MVELKNGYRQHSLPKVQAAVKSLPNKIFLRGEEKGRAHQDQYYPPPPAYSILSRCEKCSCQRRSLHKSFLLSLGFTHFPRGPVPGRRPAPQSPIARMHDPNPTPGNLAARRVQGHDIFPPIFPAHIMWTVFQSGSEIVSPLAAMIVWRERNPCRSRHGSSLNRIKARCLSRPRSGRAGAER